MTKRLVALAANLFLSAASIAEKQTAQTEGCAHNKQTYGFAMGL